MEVGRGLESSAVPPRVLVAESTQFYARLLEQVLVDKGCSVEMVSTFEEVRSEVARHDYDLICLARHLVDGEGPKIARVLRASNSTERVPLVMMTADQDQGIFGEAYEAGFTEVFFRGELERVNEYMNHFVQAHREERRLVGRVLYLEDTRWLANVTIGLLHSLGLFVDHFTSVQPALEAFEKRDYDLVCTDIVLEGAESGVSLVRKVRARNDRKSGIPILAVTGHNDQARRIELFRAGVSDYVCKPVITEELVSRVSHLIINKQLLQTVADQQEELVRMATIDVLTGLFNRRHLGRIASEAIASARSTGEPLSVLLLDIDHFKALNDTQGHQAGDMVLTQFGALLSEHAQEHDAQAARYGGEEFLLLCSSCTQEQALASAETLRAAIAVSEPGGLSVTASIGVATLQPYDEFHHLVERADSALYKAKAEGRNKVVVGLPTKTS